ncbi:unnamed protein product [Cylindrotheca closterium]|uniref:Uncharacterized protein n=1 Tax=Cylindrotheca closterium TaxID=2856 RepID=A0AAD2FLQ3_9STRA|nr:unnamed protein product [Cylindrotheca closterium]
MVSPMIRRTAPSGEKLYMADQQVPPPTPISRLSLIGDENIHASPMGMTIISPDELSASVSHLETPSASREVGTEIENRVGSLSSRRGRRGNRSLSLQHTPLPPSSALVIPGSHSKQQANSVSSKKSRSRRSMSRVMGENADPTEREVKALHARFNAIQSGLGSIDHERVQLVEKSKELEEEKLALEEQLELRDNEIHALVKRCANQEEKIREYSKLRSQNRELATDLQGMVQKLETMKSSSTDLHQLKRQLRESEHEREELQKRLEWVEKEHDAIAGTLSECLENIRKLTTEKKQLEEDRIRERQRSDMEMEKQRLNMVQLSNDLQSDLQQKQQQIDEMEIIIQQQSLKRETSSTMSSTREGSAEDAQLLVTRYDDHFDGGSYDSDILDARLKKTVRRYEKQIAEMKEQVESHIQVIMEEEEQKRLEAATAYERRIESMHQEILESESKEDRLFELQSKLAKQDVEIKREKESTHQVREAAERYEKTISDLKVMLEEKDQEVKEKNEANKELETQIARHEMDLQSQVKTTKKSYEEKVAELGKLLREQKIELQSSEESRARLQASQSEKEALASSYDIRVTQLQTQISQQEIDLQTKASLLARHESKIISLESQAKEQLKLKDLVAEHETKATQLQNQIKQHETEAQFAKSEYEGKIAFLERELTEKNNTRMAVESENRALIDAKNDLEARMKGEHVKLKDLMAEHGTKTTLLQTQIKQQETELQFAKTEYESRISGLEKELTEKMHVRLALESVNRSLLGAKNDLEVRISELVSSHERNVRDLQDKVNKKETELVHVKDEASKLREELKVYTKKLAEQGEILTSGKEMNTKLKEMKKECEDMMSQLRATIASLQSRIEQQRTDVESKDQVIAQHENTMTELQDQLKTSENTIKKLETQFEEQENAIAEKTKEVTTNNSKVADLKDQLGERMRETAKTKKEMKQILTEHSETMVGVALKTDKLRNKLIEMKEKLDERDELISNLENEFGEQMQELMNKQVILDRVEDQKQLLEAQVESLQHFEDEHAAMVHYIEIMESNCAELTAENGILNVEKDSLVEDKLQLQEKLEGFEGRVATLRDKHIAREEEVKADLEQETAKLREELDKMNQQLVSKTDEVNKVRMEAKATLENMQVSLAKARDEIVELEDQLGWEKTLQTQPTDASEEIDSLTQELEAETRRREALQEKFDSSQVSAESMRIELLEAEREQANLREELEASQEDIAMLGKERVALLEGLEATKEEIVLQEKERIALLEELEAAKEDIALQEKERIAILEELEAAKEDIALQEKERIVLLEELEAAKEDIAQQEKERVALLEELEAVKEDIAQQEKERVALLEELEAVKEDIALQEKERVALLEVLEAAKEDIAQQEQERVAIIEELEAAKEDIAQQEQERVAIIEELEAAKEDIALQGHELERRDKRISNLVSEIDALSRNDHKEAFIEAESQKLELEGQLADMRRQEAELEQALNGKEKEIEKMKAYCSELEEKTESMETQLLSTEDDLIEKLDVAVNNFAEKEAALSAMRESLAARNAQIESLESDVKIEKDKEVELLGRLSEAESKIASYESELGHRTEKIATLQKQIHGASESTRRRISDFETKIHQMKTDLALKDDEIRDLRMVDLKDAEEEISELKASLKSKRVLEQELRSKRSSAIELQKTVNDLKMNQTRLLTQERDLMAECDRLFKSEREAKEMVAKMESELQSMVQQRKNYEAEMRSKKLSQECELRKLENEASERDEKLSEVVIINEGLETKLNMRERELEEERQELDSKRGEITKLRREFFEKENGLKQQLNEERRTLEVAEQTLESMKRQQSEAIKYRKQASQKEKEIEGLKDKVKRQEAYMQKRMQREKMPSRVVVVADSTPVPTPAPKNSRTAQSLAASHLARRRHSGIPSKPTTTGGATSTPSTSRKARASLLPIVGFKSPGFRDDLD